MKHSAKILSLLMVLMMAFGMVTLFAMNPTEVHATASGSFKKVTSTDDLEDGGQYLIVYEAGKVAFNGSLSTLDAVKNTVAVTISNSEITATDQLSNATFTLEKSGDNYTIKSKSGYYIGQTSNANG